MWFVRSKYYECVRVEHFEDERKSSGEMNNLYRIQTYILLQMSLDFLKMCWTNLLENVLEMGELARRLE